MHKKYYRKSIIHDSLFIIRKSKGFTLIELLIVIVIIGILATLIMANFVGIRQRARDGQRKSDLRQMQAALEMYRADKNSYPLTASNPFGDCTTPFKNPDIPTIIYLQSVPCDPLVSGRAYHYESVDGTIYSLVACLENENDTNKDGTRHDSCSTGSTDFPVSFTVKNP